ncbi:hypothetical protein N7448_007563 [Penicillium atrosanguineum]|uniref:uncharacterized protein n=1 Tax=Penicillium atrosanguineum TaxID=1132637 RepID=UPI0023A6A2A7|nr:uncharacterized protein N7443_001413 [Penicillium atrosanguineum]KAJ5126784.1 hypothetical protein N7448_007563 [Penicillium atrosanguineum]KAJ5314529.1 hypothetical protein N7443_001413 [Penicillium atrosanguineum]
MGFDHDTQVSRRLGASKSRAGCKTCKIRRVKCDEIKPCCRRCSSTGRHCQYEGARYPAAPSTPSPTGLILSRNLSQSPNSGQRERRAFEYYFQHAAHYLSGGLGVNFWTLVVPQICRSEPAVWDAMIAISALYEYPDQCLDFHFLRKQYDQTQSMNRNSREALNWYSRSMSSVRSQIERGNADPYISLISCVLFICIETIQGRVEEALQLYRQGVQLILDLRVQVALDRVSVSKAALLEHTLIPLFLRLGNVSLTVSGTQPSELYRTTEKTVSSSFSSVDSARAAIVLLSAEAMIFEGESTIYLRSVDGDHAISADMIEKKKSLSGRLSRWLVGYTSLCDRLRTKYAIPTATEPILLAYHASASIVVTGCLTQLQTVYDVHSADFSLIIEQTSLTLNASAGPGGSQPPFTFEMGTGIPLAVTVMKCRDPVLRRKALALLKKAPPVQGFFKCTPVALLAENLMKLEEGYSLDSKKAAQSSLPNISPGSNQFASLAVSQHEVTPNNSPCIPEEARISGYAIFKPRNGLLPGIKEEHITRWGRSSDHLFLQFTRNRFDKASVTWKSYSECVPLG